MVCPLRHYGKSSSLSGRWTTAFSMPTVTLRGAVAQIIYRLMYMKEKLRRFFLSTDCVWIRIHG
jgi:hypothetical protein